MIPLREPLIALVGAAMIAYTDSIITILSYLPFALYPSHLSIVVLDLVRR